MPDDSGIIIDAYVDGENLILVGPDESDKD